MSAEQPPGHLREAAEVAKKYRNRYLAAKRKLRRVSERLREAESELETALTYLRSGDGEWAVAHVERALDLLYAASEAIELVEE